MREFVVSLPEKIHNGAPSRPRSPLPLFPMQFRGQERVNFQEFAIKIRYRPRHPLCMKITHQPRDERALLKSSIF